MTNSMGGERSAPIFVIVAPVATQVVAWGNNSYGQTSIPANLGRVVAVSSGGSHSLALKADGTVVAWGQTGYGSYGQTLVPADLNEVVAIAAGGSHSLALKADGTVVAWGGNYAGQATVPVGLSNVVAISAGSAHSLALKADGTVVTWGYEVNGLGIVPAGLTNVVGVSAGGHFSLALKADGTVVGWGTTDNGVISIPPEAASCNEVSAGVDHVLALKADGTVIGWGSNINGALNFPADVGRVSTVSAGAYFSTALKADGTVAVWGLSFQGQLDVPVGLDNAIMVSSGGQHTLALRDAASVSISSQPVSLTREETLKATFSVAASGLGPISYQWRKNGADISGATSATYTIDSSSLADAGDYDVVVSNAYSSRTSAVATLTIIAGPVITNQSTGWQIVSLGETLNLGVAATGTGLLRYQWTHNGQPIGSPSGTGSNLVINSLSLQDAGHYVAFVTDDHGVKRSKPIFVRVVAPNTQVRAWSGTTSPAKAVPADLNDVVSIAAGRGWGLAIKRDKTVVAWGLNSTHQTEVPEGLSQVEAVTAGNGYSLALKSDGTVVGWGSNNYGANVVPAGLDGVVEVSAGDSHAVALKSNGQVVAWGSNNYSQTNVPAGLASVFTISAGGFHTLAIQDDGTVVAWGENGSGQSRVPAGLNNIVAVAAGYAHSLALRSDGTVVAWGSNSYGETIVPTGLTGVVAIAAARYHSLALKADGTVVAWGSTSDGNMAAPGDLNRSLAIADGTGFSLALRDATGESVPAITSQPASLSLAQGQRAAFAVVANGPGVLGYQWRKNGVNIDGATSASYTIAETIYADAGNYDVVVSNYIGSVTSGIAALTVNPPAVITSLSPTRQVLGPGQNLNLSVTATGVGPLSYQWTRNGRPIAGATGSTYVVTGVNYADAGWYLVYVTDSNGTKRSAPIFVTVAPLVTETRAWGSNGYHELDLPAGLNNSNVIAIAAGSVTSLALKRDGTVVAWGDDWRHSGNTTIPAGLSNVVAIAAGTSHSMALKSDGTVVVWGWYSSGLHPAPAGLNNVVAIAANENHSYALKSDGTIVIWGDSSTGMPKGLTDLVGIAAPGSGDTMVLKNDGSIAYWRDNLGGQDSVPANFTNATAISAGSNHSLALKGDGTVVGWAMTPYSSEAVNVPAGLNGVVAIEAGGYHSLALKSDGRVVAWGGNDSGQITVPADLANVFAISAGTWFSLALRDATSDGLPVITTQPASLTRAETGSATFSVSATGPGVFSYQWRKNYAPIVGATSATLTLTDLLPAAAGDYDVVVTNHIGSIASSIATLTVNPIAVVTTLSPNRQVLTPGQTINLSVSAVGTGPLSYQWYRNNRPIAGATGSAFSRQGATYQDGGAYTVRVTDNYGSRTSAPLFVIVAPAFSQLIGWGNSLDTLPTGLITAVAIATGWSSSFALKPDGTVVSWGSGVSGGNVAPARVANVVAIAAGYFGGIVLKGDGTVATWNTFWDASQAPPSGLNNVIAVSAGSGHYLALKSDGKVVAWGENNYGQCNVPAGLADVVSIVADTGLSMAIKSDGTLVVWGDSSNGKTTLPAGLADVGTAGANYHNAFAVKSDGSIIAWGSYNYSQPRVPTDLTSVTSLATGSYFTLALRDGGTVVAWGINNNGETLVPAGLNGVFAVAAADGRVLALRDTGGISAPTIEKQPQALAIVAGATAQFTVTAIGGPSPTYQWQRLPVGSGTWSDVGNGSNYSGATSSTLSVSSTTLAMSGDQFRCVATNASGLATSDAATLTVNPAPLNPMLITMTGTIDSIGGYYLPSKGVKVGTPFTITAVFDSAITPYTVWAGQKNFDYPTAATISLNGLVYTLPNFRVTAVDNLVYAGTNLTTVDGHVIQGTTAASPELSALQFTSILYSRNTNLVNIAASNALQFAQPEDYNYLRFFRLEGSDLINSYPNYLFNVSGGVSTLSVVPLEATQVAPSFTVQPTNQSVMVGQTAQFNISSAGLPLPSLQWQRSPKGSGTWSNLSDGGGYTGVNLNTLTVGGESGATDGDQFRCVATNVGGTVVSNAAALTMPVLTPIITVQPTSLGVKIGSSVSLSVTVASPSALTYLWMKAGQEIPGATSSTYNIASFAAGDVGSYTVVVTNSAGSVTSDTATLAIALPPVITQDPVTRTVYEGTQTIFSVAATSNAPLSYVWRKNASPITGTNSADYVIAKTQLADAGEYTVEVSNVAGSVTSAPAGLIVNPAAAPVITTQPVAQSCIVGSTASFSIVASGVPTPSYQWQRMVVGSSTWGDVAGASFSGATTTTLTVPNLSLVNSGDQFRCLVTNVAGSITSVPATLTVASAGYARIGAGRYHSLRLDSQSRLYAAGVNTYGQLGDGTATSSSSPVPVTLPGSTVVAMAAGAQHSLFLSSANELWASGYNGNGQLGDGTLIAKTAPFKLATNVAGTAAAVFHSAILKTDGTLWTFGGNDSGQLGNSTLVDSAVPVQVATGVIDVALGNRQSFYLKADGTLWGMGDMNGSGVPVITPVQVATNVKSVAAGAYHSLILKTDGTLWTMGYNAYGQLGNGTTTDALTPVQIAANVTAIAAGYFHSAFLKADRSLWMMGYNSGGQLGDGTTINHPMPFQLATGVAAVSAGESYTLFTKMDGSLWGTGYNAYGQFGNGGTVGTTAAVQISSGLMLAAAAPVGLTASTVAALDRVHLTWQTAADTVSYEVWRATTNDSSTATLLTSGLRWGLYEDVTAANGQTYYYWIKAVNPVGKSPFSAVAVGATTLTLAPVITTQPQSQMVNVGDSVSFTVVANGTAPLSYQWRKGGVEINGATASTYTITGALAVDAGSYDVVVGNGGGNVPSDVALLSVKLLTQAISFNAPADRAYTPMSFAVSATASSGLSVTFSVRSGPATISGSDLTLTGTGVVTVRASQGGNATYAPADDVDRSFSVTGNFSAWALDKFTISELADMSISGPNADPDRDGCSNLVEYALGLEPKVVSTNGLPEMNATETDWVYTYTRPVERNDVTYTVEWSTDLNNWTAEGVTLNRVLSDNGVEVWRATYPLALSAKVFFRLKVSQ